MHVHCSVVWAFAYLLCILQVATRELLTELTIYVICNVGLYSLIYRTMRELNTELFVIER